MTERHLGLVPVPEQRESDPLLEGLSQEVARQVDLEAILAVAECGASWLLALPRSPGASGSGMRQEH